MTTGFSKDLEIVGVGYRAIAKGQGTLELALGFSHPDRRSAPTDYLRGSGSHTDNGARQRQAGRWRGRRKDRELRKPEPYKGKGVRYAGEVVRRKAGKAAK